MRIACVDKSAAARLSLLELLDDALAECRTVIGHVTVFQPFPVSKDELLVNAQPDAVVVGPDMSVDEAFLLCKEIGRAHPMTPILVLVSSNIQSFGLMQRFESISAGVFAVNTESARLVHSLCSLALKRKEKNRLGKLVTLSGVKGGVGVTTVAGGLAHAAEALGLKSVVVDLSSTAALSLYLLSGKQHSSEFTTALLDGILPDRALIERMILQTPCGINVLLSPTGGPEVREVWLRNPDRFELMLTVIDVLLELFDLVLVDLARAEGVLPYALTCRSAANMLISSNDPAAVHLLARQHGELLNVPGNAELHLLINETATDGLADEDIVDFLCAQGSIPPEEISLQRVGHDRHGRAWVGTGNSFYTESSRSVQRDLEFIASTVLELPVEERVQGGRSNHLLASLRKLTVGTAFLRKRSGAVESVPRLMPPDTSTQPFPEVLAPESAKPKVHPIPLSPERYAANSTELTDPSEDPKLQVPINTLYQPPVLQTDTP